MTKKEVQRKSTKKADTVNNKKTKNKKLNTKEKFNIKKYLTKENIIYLLVFLADIIIIIYTARKNIINYVTLENNDPVYLGDKHNLFLGRNYITLFTTFIVYIYFTILNKFYFKKKIQLKYLIIVLFSLLLVNCILFYLFTTKVY